jgi:hypothetical protein
MNQTLRNISSFLKKHKSLFISVSILWIFTAVILVLSIRLNGGNVIYSFDDAYIHMAIAKNFATTGIWGISPDGFASCSSSPLWTALIALIYFFAGINSITPLILNIISATAIFISLYVIFTREGIRPAYVIYISIFLTVLTPLPFLIFTGLEHVLHILLSILFIYLVSDAASTKKIPVNVFISLAILSAVLPLVRYEGIVLVLISAVALLYSKKWSLALLMSVLSFIPLFLYGVYSIHQGWSFFPNSLSLKGDIPDVLSLKDFLNVLLIMWNKIFDHISMLHIFILAAVLLVAVSYPFLKNKFQGLKQKSITILFLFGANIILYILFSKSVWSYRYSSFLVALGIFVFYLTLHAFKFSELRPDGLPIKKALWIVAALILLFPVIYFGIKGIENIIYTPRMTTNIYEQQYQMSMFLKRFYKNKVVALNDIGATNFYADIKCVDLVGISDKEISAKRRQHEFNTSLLNDVTGSRNVNIAILYDIWFSDGEQSYIPSQWFKVGEWKIQGEVLAGDNTISFYAVTETDKKELIKNLVMYSGELPISVIQSGIYKNFTDGYQ